MSEKFTVLFQQGFFKIMNDLDRKLFTNYCTRHRGKLGTMEITDGFRVTLDENGEIDNLWDKVGGYTSEGSNPAVGEKK